MFKSFSEETLRFRFFRIIRDTPHEVRTRYCNIDYDREIAIVAEIEQEGKRSLMVIHTLQTANARDRKRLITILNMHSSDQKLKDEAIAIMEKHDSINYVKRTANKMVQESWKEVAKLLPTSDAKQKLKAFAEFLIERNI